MYIGDPLISQTPPSRCTTCGKPINVAGLMGACTCAKKIDWPEIPAQIPPLVKAGQALMERGIDRAAKTSPAEEPMSKKYPKYFKDVSDISEIDVYLVHHLFNIQDPSGAIQHASKKLLLSGVRTGGKSAYDDIREARDSLNRWLAINKPKG